MRAISMPTDCALYSDTSTRRFSALVLGAVLGLGTSLPAGAPLAGMTERVSVDSAGGQGTASAQARDQRRRPLRRVRPRHQPRRRRHQRYATCSSTTGDRHHRAGERRPRRRPGEQLSAARRSAPTAASSAFFSVRRQPRPGDTNGIRHLRPRPSDRQATERVSVHSAGPRRTATAQSPRRSAPTVVVAFTRTPRTSSPATPTVCPTSSSATGRAAPPSG